MKKNRFLKQYTEPFEPGEVRVFACVMLLQMNVVNMMCMHMAEISLMQHAFSDTKIRILFGLAGMFDLWALAVLVFAHRLQLQVFLLSATGFAGSSLYYLYLSMALLVTELGPPAWPFALGCAGVYALVIAAMVTNLREKFRMPVRRPVKVRHVVVLAAALLVSGVGVLKLTDTAFPGLMPVIVLMLLSCSLVLTGTGFHKYILIKKSSGKRGSHATGASA